MTIAKGQIWVQDKSYWLGQIPTFRQVRVVAYVYPNVHVRWESSATSYERSRTCLSESEFRSVFSPSETSIMVQILSKYE